MICNDLPFARCPGRGPAEQGAVAAQPGHGRHPRELRGGQQPGPAGSRAGNEPSRKSKFHNDGEGPY